MNVRTMIGILVMAVFLCPARVNAQIDTKEAEQLDFAQGLLSRGMYDMAVLQCQKFISEYPHSQSLQEAYLSLGEAYFLVQDFQKATDTFNQFKQLYPNSEQLPISILRLGQIDIQQQKYDEALKELTSIDVQKQLKGPMLQSFDFYTAQAYLGQTGTANALAFFQKAAQIDGATAYTAYAFDEIGKINFREGHYDQAIDAYTKAVPLAQDDSLKAELIYRTAEVEFLSDKYDDAIKGFEQVLNQYPASDFAHDALANLLLAYFNAGQYSQLLREYQKEIPKIKGDESYFAVHMAAVLAYVELKQYDQANALLNRVLAIPGLKSQETAKVFIKKADILIREGKYKDGMALLDAYSAEDISDADETFFLKGQAYWGLGDFDHAFNSFENVYLNFPGSRFSKAALLGEAHARQKTGRYKESEALFAKYNQLQDNPDLKSDALYDAVMMAVKAGDVSGAVSSAQEYLKVYPTGEKYGEVLLILADSYGKNNQAQAAVDLLQGYLAVPTASRPNSANFLLGFNQQSLGNSDKALAAYGQVDPNKENGAFYDAALKNMALLYLAQGNQDQARTYFDLLINLPNQNDLQVKTYLWVCNEYLKKQRFADVLRVAAQAEKHFAPPDLIEIKYFEAEALRALGRCDDAGKDYDIVTASTPKDAYTGSAHIGYGLCLESSKKLNEAKEEFQKPLDENADDYTVTVHARFELANVDVAQGNFDDALKLYLLVATIYDDDYYCSESLLRAGRIFERFKHKADALKLYQEILDKYKNSTAAHEARERIRLLK